jgi:hypothetical protein
MRPAAIASTADSIGDNPAPALRFDTLLSFSSDLLASYQHAC